MDEWQCDYGQCISFDKKCDGSIDCPEDTSDERDCARKFFLDSVSKLCFLLGAFILYAVTHSFDPHKKK
jgi:hypothetical protein